MVSPLRTLQSSNSLRKSIASLAWFNASCIWLLLTALLRRLLPRVAMGFRLRLEAQLSPLLAVARAVAEKLFLAGEVLRRAMDRARAIPGRRLHAEIRIGEVRARQRHEIGAARGDDGIDLV